MNPPPKVAGRSDAIARMKAAEEFASAAELMLDAASNSSELPNAYVTNAVHAGIAAADVICIVRLGTYVSNGEHTEAVLHLKKIDRVASSNLQRLLAIKTKAGYSPTPVSNEDVRTARRAHGALLETARAAIAGF